MVASLAALSLLMAACGSSSKKTTTSATAATPTTAAAAVDNSYKCVDPNATKPADGSSLSISWGPASTGDNFQKFVVPLIKQKLNLNVTYVGAASSDTMAKLVAQNGSSDYDLVITSYGPLEQGRTAGVLQKLDFTTMPESKKVTLDPNTSDSRAMTLTNFAYGLAYNTDILKKNNLPEPTKIQDMLNPQYESVMGMYTPPFAGAVAQIAIINKILGGPPNDLTQGINALAKMKKAKAIANSGQMDNAFAAGQVGMYFSASATVQTFLESGLPIKMVFDPAYGTGIYDFIPKGAKNTAAACEVMNLLASADGQTALHKVNGNLPTRTDGVTLRTDIVMASAAKQQILSYPDLIKTAPSADAITEQWNKAFNS